MAKCRTCGTESAIEVRTQYINGIVTESCDHCGTFIMRSGTPDVYFRKPYFDPNLADPNDPKTWDGQMVHSKQHKSGLMKKFNLRESGDRVHGARTEYRPEGQSRKAFFKVDK